MRIKLDEYKISDIDTLYFRHYNLSTIHDFHLANWCFRLPCRSSLLEKTYTACKRVMKVMLQSKRK